MLSVYLLFAPFSCGQTSCEELAELAAGCESAEDCVVLHEPHGLIVHADQEDNATGAARRCERHLDWQLRNTTYVRLTKHAECVDNTCTFVDGVDSDTGVSAP